jgi:hypothetical protein
MYVNDTSLISCFKGVVSAGFIIVLKFLIDNIFVMFGGRVFQQTVGIPMGTNCDPLLANLFLYSYEADFIQGDKQRSTKHTYRTKDRVARTPLKTGGELRCSRRVGSSCSTSGTRRVNLVTNPVISREWGKDREVFTTSGRYPWSFVTQIFHNGHFTFRYID